MPPYHSEVLVSNSKHINDAFSTYMSLCWEKNENKQKVAGFGPFKKPLTVLVLKIFNNLIRRKCECEREVKFRFRLKENFLLRRRRRIRFLLLELIIEGC